MFLKFNVCVLVCWKRNGDVGVMLEKEHAGILFIKILLGEGAGNVCMLAENMICLFYLTLSNYSI